MISNQNKTFLFPTHRTSSSAPFLQVVLSLICLVALIFWARETELKIFAKAIGQIVPAGELADVQDIEGGVVETLFVKEGDKVKHGDELVRLNVDAVRNEIDILQARKTELQIQKTTLDEDMSRMQKLFERGLTTVFKVNEIGRQVSQLDGLLKEVHTQIADANLRLQDRSILAPVSGVVQDIQIFRAGDIVSPYKPFMKIVPDDVELKVDAEILANDIGELTIGDMAEIKLSAFDYTKYGKMSGTVTFISAFTRYDRRDNLVYDVSFSLNKDDLEDFSRKVDLIPGLVADVDVITGEHTLLDIILKPVIDSYESVFLQQ